MIQQATWEDVNVFCKLIEYEPTPQFRGIKLVNSNNEIVAMTGYDFWTNNAVQMHIYISSPQAFVSRKFITECFRYPFVIAEKGLVLGVTPAANIKALEFNKRLGFREIYRVKDGCDVGEDMVIQEIRREECRWIQQVKKVA